MKYFGWASASTSTSAEDEELSVEAVRKVEWEVSGDCERDKVKTVVRVTGAE